MGSCCHNKENDLAAKAEKHRNVLVVVLIINLLMFFVEMGFGWYANSLALTGDALDMLGDAITYASSLWVLGMGTVEKARVARLKAIIMLLFGGFISARCIYRGMYPVVPEFGLMFGVGVLALIMNLVCLFLLTRHKEDDINMKSVWICSRNDIVANSSVLSAAVLVYFTSSPYPDIAVGVALAWLFTKSAISILHDARLVTNAATVQAASK